MRFDRPANGVAAAKQCRTMVFCEDRTGRRQWRSQGLPVPRPLFGLADLAGRPEAVVVVTEGEKSTEAAARLFPDHLAVTSPNGSKSARRADWSPLAKRHVIIWPDADEAGAAYASDVAALAKEAGAVSVRVVPLPTGLPQGWDVADPLPDALASLDLIGLLQAASKPRSEGPLPLFPDLSPAEAYPIDALGPVLSHAAAAIAKKVQVPDAMAAQAVLATAALAAQALADVQLPYGQTRPLSLFFVTVAASGDRKSSADNEALWPVVKREKTMREEYQAEMARWRIAQGVWASEKKKIESDRKMGVSERKARLEALGEEPAKPLTPLLIASDLTGEGPVKNWASGHAALGIFTAEGGTFSGGHGMSDDARLWTAAMLSELWDGRPVKRVRALDGVTILPGRRLSMHIMIQPEAAASFLGHATLRDQGLLSRVLAAAPPSLAGTRLFRDTDPADEAAIRAYGARILSLLEGPLPLADGTANELDPPALAIANDAKAMLGQFADHIERQCGSSEGLKPISDFAAKAAEHAARIAGVLTIVADRSATTIGRSTMENALALAEWYVVETLRLQQAGRRDPKLAKARLLLEWLQERSIDTDFRDILRLGPSPLRNKAEAEAEAALKLLLEHGWISETSQRPHRFRLVDVEAR